MGHYGKLQIIESFLNTPPTLRPLQHHFYEVTVWGRPFLTMLNMVLGLFINTGNWVICVGNITEDSIIELPLLIICTHTSYVLIDFYFLIFVRLPLFVDLPNNLISFDYTV